MKSFAMATMLVLSASLVQASVQGQVANPIEKVLSMISDLQSKIIKEGQVAQKTYDEFAEWCEDRSRNVQFEIKDGKKDVASETATIESSVAKINSLKTKIEELADAISTDEADLTAATNIRNKEEADFSATEKDLVETIDTLERAILILEKEMKKGGAAMVQMQKAGNNLAQALSVMVDASMINTQDASKLTALMQNSESDEDSDAGAPAAAVYEGHSGGIIDTLENLLEKAKTSLETARAKEAENVQNFHMLKQGLEDEIKYANSDLSETKKGLAKTEGTKATAEGDLSVANKDLTEDKETLSTLHQDCLEKANDFEAETKSRGEELKALALAKKIISDMASGADSVAYGFLQVDSFDSLHNSADLANFEAVRMVRELARKMNDSALAQLATRMATAVRRAKDGSSDPFAKVKELIKGMIEKLLSDAQTDASHKAYCDKELAESNEKKTDRTANIEKLTSEIDSMSATSAKLKEQVAVLQKQLAGLARSQAEMDRIRSEEKAEYEANKAEMEDGIKGVQLALKVLRDYYAKGDATAAQGAGGGIVGMLEVVESDFTKGLAEMRATEQASAADYDRESKSNEITKATKDQSVKYKTKEFKGLDKSVAETTSDRSTVKEELAAVNKYLAQLDPICIAKPETYGERKARREAEIDGLKEALNILEGEAVLLQRKSYLRGISKHA